MIELLLVELSYIGFWQFRIWLPRIGLRNNLLFLSKYLLRNPVASNIPMEMYWNDISVSRGRKSILFIILRSGILSSGSDKLAFILNILLWYPVHRNLSVFTNLSIELWRNDTLEILSGENANLWNFTKQRTQWY